GESDKALRLIDEALAISDETGERWALAEVLRMKAGLLLAVGETPANEIEALLLRSFSTARHQQARCWELRTACGLARLWHAGGRSAEAHSLLSSSYDQFDEGHGTPELQEAQTLIETLRQAVNTKQPQRSERRSERDAALPAPVLKFDGAVVGGAKWGRGLLF